MGRLIVADTMNNMIRAIYPYYPNSNNYDDNYNYSSDTVTVPLPLDLGVSCTDNNNNNYDNSNNDINSNSNNVFIYPPQVVIGANDQTLKGFQLYGFAQNVNNDLVFVAKVHKRKETEVSKSRIVIPVYNNNYFYGYNNNSNYNNYNSNSSSSGSSYPTPIYIQSVFEGAPSPAFSSRYVIRLKIVERHTRTLHYCMKFKLN